MAVPCLPKMKRADVIEELARVYDYAEPPNHNLQMLKSILLEQRIFRQAQSIFKLPPMPTRKVDIIKALKEEGYDMARLTGREDNSLLQRRLLFLRQHNKVIAAAAIDDAQQALRDTKYIQAWERFAMDIQVYNRTRQSLTEILNDDRLRTDPEVISDVNSPRSGTMTPDSMPSLEDPPGVPSSAVNSMTISEWAEQIFDPEPPRIGLAISRFRLSYSEWIAENEP